jgi:hypothetical protein
MSGYQQTFSVVQAALINTAAQLDPWFDSPAALRSYRLDAESWSIDEILEHVSLTSHFLLIVIRNGRDRAIKRAAVLTASIQGESDLAALAAISHPDAFAWSRPEHMEPSRNKTSAEVRLILREQFDSCLAILDTLSQGQGSLVKVRMSVQNLGKLDLYQWLYFLASHAARHHAEIERIAYAWSQDTPSRLP